MTCSAIRRTFMKDLQHLCRTIDASTDGQASIVRIDEMTVKVLLRPKSGYNAHGEFLLTIKCCPTYPKACPDVSFDSPIFHPNIDPEWRSCYCLMDLVKAVLYVIDRPAFDSPNNRFGALKDPAQLSTNTARVLAGLPVKGRRFPPNRAWLQWARANGCLPTREEEMEEVEEELRKREDLVQNWGDGVNVPATNMGSEDKVNRDSNCVNKSCKILQWKCAIKYRYFTLL
ncbi:Ubiquitin carrier protein [Echinococcus multilocularis]|uniref:Ubiquitin carrier protein n=1 Tax=Echinococcus multilocularis TaxID=6211 RepID=A0A068Y729_ECHMU|nr:Ubiquitin carrier protein [Echinococcus multilocularis]